MKIKNYNIHTFSHFISIFLLLSVFCLTDQNTQAQELRKDVSLSFVKDSTTLRSRELFFNTLRICNLSTRPISGTVAFSCPDNWRIITFSQGQTTIQPGDTLWIPFRVSSDPQATGAVSYLIHASFRSGDNSVTATSYMTVPPSSKWDFTASGSSSFITENFPYTSFNVKLSNKGNTPELIRLDYKLGKTLTFRSDAENYSPVEYVSLPPYKDTVITRTVTLQQNLSYAEKMRFERNWKESAIMLTASTEIEKRSSEIQIKRLNSSYTLTRAQANSPLNIDYNVFNLMSSQLPRHNLNLYGNVLFDRQIDIQYNAGVQNLAFGSNTAFDMDRQLVYNVRFTDPKNNILLSYNTFTGGLHSVNGRGISGDYEINRKHNVSYAFIQNPFTSDIGGSVGYGLRLSKVALSTQFTQEINPLNGYSATSLMAGASFTLLKYHRFNLNLLGANARYKQVQGRDTSAFGLSYKFNYSLKYKKLDLKLNAYNTALNRIKNAGIQQYYLDARYPLNDKIGFVMYGNVLSYSTTRYPYNFYHPTSFNKTEYLRTTINYSVGNVTYQFGPNYSGSTRNSTNSFSGYNTVFKTFQPGVWAAASFRIDGYKSVSPNVTFSKLYVNYQSNNPNEHPVTVNNGLAYSVGINYFDEKFKLNAYYSSGSSADLYRDYQVYEQPSLTRSLQVRPTYEDYIFNRSAKISAYLNYAYYLPTERQNIAYNLRYEHFFKKNWNVYVSGFVFSNSRKDESGGRLNTMDLNFVAGIRKSFNLQQPRVKYYDLRTIFFNDLDGDRIKSDNEPPVSNILVRITKKRSDSLSITHVPQIELISNVKGEVLIENLPKDLYEMSYQPVVNLQSYYFLNGSEQQYLSDKTRVLYVPLVESYKIKGRVNVARDPNSGEGRLNMDGIRLTATGTNGEVYSVLTDRHGAYILNVPNADKYVVRVSNVFGEHFVIDNDEIMIQFSNNKTINLDFNFVEKKREINFNNGNQIFKFNSN